MSNKDNKPLLILESPKKASKIQNFLKDEYNVSFSKGHIRTLGKYNELGINIDDNFKPNYIIDENKQMVVANLKKIYKKSKSPNIIIATDYDREGEAIGWHICDVLGIDIKNAPRLIFKTITEKEIRNSLKNPSYIDMNMVYSQQARMILDKLIGFKLCDIIHRHFKNYKLSAGRVQSIVSKLIIEREKEILEFKNSNYSSAIGYFVISKNKLDNKKYDLEAKLTIQLKDINDASNIITLIDNGNAKFNIIDKNKNNTIRKPSPPFITSSLQQEACNRFNMSPKSCMSSAQKLYEAGLITYMRTDSFMLSNNILNECEKYIKKTYGDDYYEKKIYNKKKKNAQEAHEACRPVNINRLSVLNIDNCGPREDKLYKLIWNRTISSQMKPAKVEIKSIKINLQNIDKDIKLKEKKYIFINKFEKILFDGFLKIYTYNKNDEEDEIINTSNKKIECMYDNLKINQELWCQSININENETQSPSKRYTEASLVNMLEKLGIGRPSTYASIIDKVQTRQYVEKCNIKGENKDFYELKYRYPNDITIDKKNKRVGAEKNKLIPTSLGKMITTYLEENFIRFMNYEFTSNIELQLDEISLGKIEWWKVIQGIYDYMLPTLNKISNELKLLKGGSNEKNKKLLGVHPQTELPIYIIRTRKGWFICEENKKNKKKSRWGSINNKTPDDITLNDAIPTLIYPFVIGKYKSKPIEIRKAKNIYISYNNKNLSIDNYIKHNKLENSLIPEEITKDECINIIKYYEELQKEQATLNKETYEFDGNTDIEIKNGMYGYYIRYLKMYNIPLPKKYKKDITHLNEEVVMLSISKFLKKNKK